jgi:hypothetical protein
MDSLRHAIDAISAKARELRDAFGDDGRARALEWATQQIEAALRHNDDQLLNLDEAARLSGYSEDHLARLVRERKIPDARPSGARGRLRLRRGDVPVKPGRRYTPDADVRDLASRLFGGKEGRNGSP